MEASLFTYSLTDRIDFDPNGQTLFCAAIGHYNTAYLTGTIIPTHEYAQLSATSTLPLDETL